MLLETLIMMRISQDSLILLILYLFYNTDLLKNYENIWFYINVTDFVNDVNIFIYYKNIEQKLFKTYRNS